MKTIVSILLFLVFGSSLQAQVVYQDSMALVDLYNLTGGPNWINHTNWLTGPVSSWYGITLNPGGNTVTDISLNCNNLTEQLPSSIGDFIFINSISLSGNYLTGHIPEEMGNLTTLFDLDLSINQFSGPLLWDNANLPNLEFFYLNMNNLNGAFPASLINGVINVIGLSHNHFTFIPDYSSQLTMSYNFYLQYNNLDFGSLEPNSVLFIGPDNYYAQDSVLYSFDTTVIQGSDLVLHSKAGGTSNLYLCTHNDVDMLGNIDSNLVMNNISFSDSGWYSCNINNTVITNLTLHRKKIHVHVVDSITPVVPVVIRKDEIRISWDNGEKILSLDLGFTAGTRVQAALYNIQGKKIRDIFRGNLNCQTLRYPLGSIQTGLYMVKVETGKQVL
ncbi:MAG: hypothetical protein NTU44_10915, partial [Bacteroidetes bacterium]|nr:hypothetical protein [Bacteroidota bacterium]